MKSSKEEILKKLYPEWNSQEKAESRDSKKIEVSNISSEQYKKVRDIMEESLKEPSIKRSNDVFFFV